MGRITVMSILLLALMATDGIAQGRTFDQEVFSLHQLKILTSKGKTATLSTQQRREVLRARQVVISLLQHLNDGRDGLGYLTPQLAKRFKDTDELARAIIDPETVLLAVAVTDYDMDKAGDITFQIYVVVESEGAFHVPGMTVQLQLLQNTWKVADYKMTP